MAWLTWTQLAGLALVLGVLTLVMLVGWMGG